MAQFSIILIALILGVITGLSTCHNAENDSLTITIADSAQLDGSYTLSCHPTIAGTHPNRQNACLVLHDITEQGQDPFAPTPEGSICTQNYGGPETATIVGNWGGKSVNASFNRRDGCEISRWEKLAPLFQKSGTASQGNFATSGGSRSM